MVERFQSMLRDSKAQKKDDNKEVVETPKRRPAASARPTAVETPPAEPRPSLKRPAAANSGGLPHGWRKEKRTRASGASVGKFDYYFIAPDGRVCRSLVEVMKCDKC